MILAVFGAGASYDSVPSKPPARGSTAIRPQQPNRLPLASELFLDTGVFADSLARFPQCHPIVPYLQAIPPGETLEHTLEVLQAESETDPERRRQIAAIRFYLHYVISECERHWKDLARGITNYVTLLDQLRRCRKDGEPVLLATLNYDRMIESALESVGVTIDSIPKYIQSEKFKLFKLHGSVHWGREVETDIENIKDLNVWQVGRELIQRSADLKITDRFRMIHEYPIGKIDDVPLFPAIAIPVERKNEFECPSDHLDCLQLHLKKVTKIILVGWSATERNFLDLLSGSLRQEVPVCVVAGEKRFAEDVLGRREEANVPAAGQPTDFGFSEFVTQREAEEFLR